MEMLKRYRGYHLNLTQDGIEVYRKDSHIGRSLIGTYPDLKTIKNKIDKVCQDKTHKN